MKRKKSKKHIQRFVTAFIFILLMFITGQTAPVMALDLGGDWVVDGFLRNNTGVWTENWDYAYNNDPLATCRNWFRINLNGSMTRSLDLKAELLAVYETEYSRERGAGVPANSYNSFDFRELRIGWRPIPGQEIYLGRQIVNWGEAISARVGDVINPQDKRFDLGFTNLEDSRIPIWMARGIHNFVSLHTSFEWIFSPYLEPDRYRANRMVSALGTVNSDGSFTPAPRFAGYPETRMAEQFGTNNAVIAIPGAAPDGSAIVVPGPLFGPPFSHLYMGPLTDAQATGIFGPAFFATPYPSLGTYLVRSANVTVDSPGSSLSDSRYGFRTSSSIAQFQTGVYFWHSNEIDATMRLKGGIPAPGGALNIVIQYPKQNVYGVYANRNFDFGVLRLDAAYRPNREYCTLDTVKYSEGIAEKDYLMVQLGLNKDMMFRNLNATAPFAFTVEYVGEFFLDDLEQIHVPTYFIPYHKDNHTMFFSVGTNYAFGMYKYDFTVIYNHRNNGLITPTFTYTPDFFNNKLSVKLAYTNVFGDNDYDFPFGLVRDSDLIVLTTQLSF